MHFRVLLLLVFLGFGGAEAQRPVRGYLADSTLRFLAPLVGRWAPVLPDSVIRAIGYQPIANHYDWVVAERAIRLRESYRAGEDPDSSDLQGLIYWNPATETVEFVAVAGKVDGQGRLFRGEYRLREDGAIEREYDVYYRTLADTPGEQFGGSRRRFRETYRLTAPDEVESTLEWWHDGAWRPFGRFARGKQRRWIP